MPTIWDRLFGSNTSRQVDQVSQQLTEMQSVNDNLAARNNQLNALLQVSFRQQGGFTRFDTIQQIAFIRQGYNISADVYAIVSDIAQKGASIPLICYEVVDDYAMKIYRSAMNQKKPDLLEAKRWKTKALRQVDYDNPIQKSADRPNETDNTTLFYETSIGFTLLCGNNYWYAPALDMGADKGKVTQLQIMPSQFTGIVLTQGFPVNVLGHELIIDGVRLMESKDVIHMRFPNYDWSVDGQQLYGLPPLKAGWNTLGLTNSAETSMLSMFQNGGPQMVLSNKSLNPDSTSPEQMGRAKKSFNDQYSGNTNRGKVMLTAGDLQAIPLGLSPVDMDMISGAQYYFDKLCNIFGVSSIMFNNHSASTESNVKEMIRDSWTRGVLPLRRMHADSFNRSIVPAYQEKGKRYFVDMDLSGIADLQPDRSVQATWLNTSWWIPANEKRKIQDLDEIDDPNMNKVLVPSGLVPLDDLSIDVSQLPNAPVDTQIEAEAKGYDPSEARDDRGRWTNGGNIITDGADFEARKKELKIPPAWTDVKINKDSAANLLATGRDAKGRVQYIYSENATMEAAAVKFARNEELLKKEGYIVRQNKENMFSGDKSTSEPAHVMSVIHSTGIRPGSERETFSKVKAYGATTLEGRHVVQSSDGVRLQFVGKKGVNIDVPVEDKGIANMLLERKRLAGDSGKIFSASDTDLREYTKKLNGGGFKPKDFRTLKGTNTAIEEVSKLSRAQNMAEYNKYLKSVSTKVSKVLGNTPSIALKSYINPSVFLNIKPIN